MATWTEWLNKWKAICLWSVIVDSAPKSKTDSVYAFWCSITDWINEQFIYKNIPTNAPSKQTNHPLPSTVLSQTHLISICQFYNRPQLSLLQRRSAYLNIGSITSNHLWVVAGIILLVF